MRITSVSLFSVLTTTAAGHLATAILFNFYFSDTVQDWTLMRFKFLKPRIFHAPNQTLIRFKRRICSKFLTNAADNDKEHISVKIIHAFQTFEQTEWGDFM